MEKNIFEMCPYCGQEVEINIEGGKCKYCGHYILPCSQCDMDKSNCNRCPYKDINKGKEANNTIEKYVKENNIKSYLNCNDIEKIVKMLTEKDENNINELEFEDNYDTKEESYVANLIENYNYELANNNEDIEYLLNMIYGCEFDLEINRKGTLNLIDEQGAYLGGADSYENFEDIQSACNRLSGAYFEDYYNLYLY